MRLAALLPVRLCHAAHKYVSKRVIAHREALRTLGRSTFGGGVVVSSVNDLADELKVGTLEPSDCDLYPVTDIELHYPLVLAEEEFSYATVRCGICGDCIGCECASLPADTQREP